MAKAYLVWNKIAEEGVIFTDYKDACYAATGVTFSYGVSTLGEDGDKYDIKEIEF